MLDSPAALDIAAALLDAARKAGADAADAVVRADASVGVSVRLGKLEDVERSEGEEGGLRVFAGSGSASISTSDFSPAGLAALAERAVAMARAAPADPYAQLAAAEQLARGPFADLDIADAAEPAPERLRSAALETEDAARSVARVTNSEGASAGFGRAVVALATSNGFSGGYTGTSHSLSASVIAGEGGGMQRDYASRSARHAEDLVSPSEIGRLAGNRAVARLDPRTLPSGPMPVVFDPRVGGSLVSHLIGAMSGPSAARRASFLLGKESEELFAPAVRIVESPHKPRGLRSRPFDGEGLATAPRALVENGRMTAWLTNLASAAQLGAPLTANAARGTSGAPGVSVSNVDLLPGDASPAELIADIEQGVWVDYLIGQGVNGVTGDYSRGAAGRMIENGELTGPVAGFTIAGNLLAMFAALQAADDLETWRAINVPTLRIDGMTIAGE
ncbi:MAG: TldD/PmbA family protein [Tsuneonella sp.]